MSDQEPTINDCLIDRLVDNELTADERRRLLVALDDEPSGWRRTALAFVEAQAWRGSMRELVQRSVQASDPATITAHEGHEVVTRASGVQRDSGRHAWRPLALAAGLLCAFTLGMFWRSGQSPDNQPDHSPGVARTDGSNAPTFVQHAEIPSSNGLPGTDLPADDALMIHVGGNGRPSRQVPVPLVEIPKIDQQLLTRFNPTVPDPFRRQLERLGFQVESQRRYAPIPLQGGRRMYVPVEDTRIVPVNMAVY